MICGESNRSGIARNRSVTPFIASGLCVCKGKMSRCIASCKNKMRGAVISDQSSKSKGISPQRKNCPQMARPVIHKPAIQSLNTQRLLQSSCGWKQLLPICINRFMNLAIRKVKVANENGVIELEYNQVLCLEI